MIIIEKEFIVNTYLLSLSNAFCVVCSRSGRRSKLTVREQFYYRTSLKNIHQKSLLEMIIIAKGFIVNISCRFQNFFVNFCPIFAVAFS